MGSASRSTSPAVLGGDPHDFTAVILIDPNIELPVLPGGEEAW
jgi:hypothetical protein